MDIWALKLCSQSGIDCSCEVIGGFLRRFLLFPIANNEYDSLWLFSSVIAEAMMVCQCQSNVPAAFYNRNVRRG